MKKPIIIITHERSGTHLLINLINYDKEGIFSTIGYMHPNEKFTLDNYKHQTYKDVTINSYLENTVSKSHHQVEFMTPYLDFLFEKYKVIYLKREIKDVLSSYYRFLNADNKLNPIPNFPTIDEWLFSNPKTIGYKFFADYPDPHIIVEPNNYIERWKLHTEGWLKYKENMLILNYEDLLLDFNNQKLIIENYTNKKIGNNIPNINDKRLPNFSPGKGIIGGYKNTMSNELITKINTYL